MKAIEKAFQEYEEMFGGIPYFLIRGMDDDEVVKVLTECVKTGEELGFNPDYDY